MATFLSRSIDALRNGRGAHHHCQVHPPERPREVFGIAVVGSRRVDPQALRNTVEIVIGMVGERPELHAHLARAAST